MSTESAYRRSEHERLKGILSAVDRNASTIVSMEADSRRIVSEGTQAIRDGRLNSPESQRFMEYAMLCDVTAGLCEAAEGQWNGTPQNVKNAYRAFGRTYGAKGKSLMDFIELEMSKRRTAQRTPDRYS